MTISKESVEDIVVKTKNLVMEKEEDWEIDEGKVFELYKLSVVGRILARRDCNTKFIKIVFGRVLGEGL